MCERIAGEIVEQRLIVFVSFGFLKKHLAPPIRACLHTALGNPSPTYLACACCSDAKGIVPTMNDTNIAYRLHLEHGKMINLADWAVQFRDVVLGKHGLDDENQGEEEEDGTREEKERVAKEIHARFVRSASELQYLGLIKGTNRRKDHVMKQAF